MSPPVEDSAMAIVSPRAFSSAPIFSARAISSSMAFLPLAVLFAL